MNNIGERLREERKKIGLSQEKLAEVGGVQKLTQFNYEAGKRSPDSAYLAKIAELGADVQYILTGKRTGEGAMLKGGGAGDESFSEEDLQILRMIKRLPPTQKKHEIKNIEVVLQSIDEAISHYLTSNGIEQQRMAA